MKNFQIMRYLKKILPIIVIICVLATYAINFKLKNSNTFVASEVIHYNDPAAEQGLTPTGSKLDVNEIKSSAVMSKVVDRMGLTGIYSVDSLISRISITPLPDEDKIAQKEAKLEEGEEYVYEPSTYVVSFTATNNEGTEFARTILDETLDVYFAEYSQKYVNVAPAKNVIDNIENENYDYIEIVEMIDTGIDETLNTLYQRMDQTPYYRATKTGVSFNDLADEFSYIRHVKLSDLFSKIYKYQITKNKTVLISDYTTRIDNNDISNTKEESIVEDTVAVIDAYVEKMRESGNTNITYEYILDNVHERNLTDSFAPGDQTVTYDELIYGWREHNEKKEHSIIDSAYCQYVIDTFQKCTGACGGTCSGLGQTCTQLSNESYSQIQGEIDTEIKEPAEAEEKGVQGRVTLSFTVTSTGKVCDVKVLRGVDPLLDNEAVRVVEMSPDWTPGMKDGKLYLYTVDEALRTRPDYEMRKKDVGEWRRNNLIAQFKAAGLELTPDVWERLAADRRQALEDDLAWIHP